MKRKFLPLLPLLLLAGCSDDENPPQPPTADGRTVLVYMAAQNSLGQDRFHRADSIEIMNGRQSIPADGRILLFIDDHRPPRLYSITRTDEKPRLVKQWTDDICSTNPKRFGEVLQYAREQFSAREYGLVMWSHADGWISSTDTQYNDKEKSLRAAPQSIVRPFSFGIDCGAADRLHNTGAQMNVADMAQAVADAGIHLKYIFFDACLMQNLEVAYALRNVTDYVVAAPMATPGAGSNYTNDIRQGFFSADPSDIARTYLHDVQAPEYSADYSDFGLSISCLRTDRLEALAQSLAAAFPHSSLTERRSPVMQLEENGTVTGVLNYQAYSSSYFYRPHNYDALQALRCILPPVQYEVVKQALDAAVVYYGSTPRFWIGPGYWTYQTVPVTTGDYRAVSMFIPQDVYTDHASSTPQGDLNDDFRQTEWYRAAGFAQTGW